MNTMNKGGVVGILGEGQLGMMLANALHELGFLVAVLGPNALGSAMKVADYRIVAAYDDEEGLKELARLSRVVTCEFENVPVGSINKLLSMGTLVFPGSNVLAIAQNRYKEKTQINQLGVPTTDWCVIDEKSTSSLEVFGTEIERINFPAILKLNHGGYDGKGQLKVTDFTWTLKAWVEDFKREPCILESKVPFLLEISVIVVRTQDGVMDNFPPMENIHQDGILQQTIWPSKFITPEIETKAVGYARQIAEALGVVGLLAVEMFVLPDGQIYVNEIAPRPHNSGHWTMDAGCSSQFEQLARVITGQSLGSCVPTKGVRMINILGQDCLKWVGGQALSAEAVIYDYGKGKPTHGRKMGHVNIPRSL